MDIQSYLSALAEKLRALGVSEEDISKQFKITRNYLESLDSDELSETLADTAQIDAVAGNIYSFIQKKKEKLVETQELNKVLAETIAASSEPAENGKQPHEERQIRREDNIPSQTQPEPQPQPEQNAPAEIKPSQQPAKPQNDSQPTESAKPKPRPEIRRYNTSEFATDHDPSSHSSSFSAVQGRQNKARRDLTSENPAVGSSSVSRDRRYDDSRYFTSAGKRRSNNGQVTSYTSGGPVRGLADSPENDDAFFVEKAHGSPLFWILFIGTLPFTALLYAALFVIYGVLFAAGAALIIGLIAVLIADIAVGTAVSLIGIIYGVTQLFNPATRAVGLYELGLGLLIGGAAMFTGILIYNIAIRLLPFLLKKLTYLLRLILGKLKDLYYTLKRRSGDSAKRGDKQ